MRRPQSASAVLQASSGKIRRSPTYFAQTRTEVSPKADTPNASLPTVPTSPQAWAECISRWEHELTCRSPSALTVEVASPCSLNMDKRENRSPWATSSHYGFFATEVSPHDCGASSPFQHTHRMIVKERRELGRRATLKSRKKDTTPKRSRSCPGSGGKHMPVLPPPGSSGSFFVVQNMTAAGTCAFDSSPASSSSSRPPSANYRRQKQQEDNAMFQLWEGIRTTILHVSASPFGKKKTWPPASFPPCSEAEVLKVYKAYCSILNIEADHAMESECSGFEDLRPIPWPSFMAWVDAQKLVGDTVLFKATCAALFSSLKYWRSNMAPAEQRESGVTLVMLFHWIWPNAESQDIARMFQMICTSDLDQLCYPVPPLMSRETQRQLENIFESMCSNGRDYCTPDDVAGGTVQDLQTKLRNVVDAGTVRAVAGCGPIYINEFLELMCEHGQRGHASATRVFLPDGRLLRLHTWRTLCYDGWIPEEDFSWDGMPESRAQRWRVVKALEAEFRRWREVARVEVTTPTARTFG